MVAFTLSNGERTSVMRAFVARRREK